MEFIPSPEYEMDEYNPIQVGPRANSIDLSERIMVNTNGLAIYNDSIYPQLMEEIFDFMINSFDYLNSFHLPDDFNDYLYINPNPRTLAIFKGPPVDDERAPPTATGGLNEIFSRYSEYRHPYREGGADGGRSMTDGEVVARERMMRATREGGTDGGRSTARGRMMGAAAAREGGTDGGRSMTDEEVVARERMAREGGTDGGRSTSREMMMGAASGRTLTREEVDPAAGEAKAGPGSETSEEEKCAICLESLRSLRTFNLPECDHSFHVECIKNMIRTSSPRLLQLPCPLCRKPFDKSSVHAELELLKDQTIKDKIIGEVVDKKCLEAVVIEFRRMIRRIIRQKLDNNILYFCDRNRDGYLTVGVSPYFIKKLLKGFLDEFVEYRNQAMIRYLYMFCLQRCNISKEIYAVHTEYLNEFLPGRGVSFKFKMKAKVLYYEQFFRVRGREGEAVEHFRTSGVGVRAIHDPEPGWIDYINRKSDLTDDDFKEGIINEIKRLRILEELVDDIRKYEHPGRGNNLHRHYERLKDRARELDEFILDFCAWHGNSRRDWFGDNDFRKVCKSLFKEFIITRDFSMPLAAKSDYEKKKYFVKLNVGPVEWRQVGDLEAIEREEYRAMQSRLGEFNPPEFNQPTPSRWSRCCTTPTGGAGAAGVAGAVEAVMEGDEVDASREIAGSTAAMEGDGVNASREITGPTAAMERDGVNESSEITGSTAAMERGGVNESREMLGGGLRHNRYGNILIPKTASLKTTKKKIKRKRTKHKRTKHKRTKNRTKNRRKITKKRRKKTKHKRIK